MGGDRSARIIGCQRWRYHQAKRQHQIRGQPASARSAPEPFCAGRACLDGRGLVLPTPGSLAKRSKVQRVVPGGEAEGPIPPGPRRRKVRMFRDEAPLDDLIVVLRAIGGDLDSAVADVAADAADSGAVYVVERPMREVLFGVSVFALRDGRTAAVVLDRFPGSPGYLRLTAGVVRSAGFGLLPTGTNPDHFDVQLIPGTDEVEAATISFAEIKAAAWRLVALAGQPWRNPVYDDPER